MLVKAQGFSLNTSLTKLVSSCCRNFFRPFSSTVDADDDIPKDWGPDTFEIKDEGAKSDEYVPRKEFPYNMDNLSKLKLDAYPFYIERAWWKEGKRMTFWADWQMLRDVKRRQALAENGPDRMRFKALKTNNVLPRAIIDEFQEKMNNMPRNSHPNLIQSMCMFTAKRRGKIKRFRLSRHVFRDFADHGKLSGVKRSMW